MGLFDKLKLDKGNKDFFVWLDSILKDELNNDVCPQTSKLNTSRHRQPAKAVSLKKICCFFCCPFGKIAKSPVVGR